MASDVYLQIDGIKGESQDSLHKEWIECSSVHWGIMQPRSACASSAGGHTAERCELDDIMFHKIADPHADLRNRQDHSKGEVRVHARRWRWQADQVFRDRTRERTDRADHARHRGRLFAFRECVPQVLEGQMALQPAKDWRRHRWFNAWRMGPQSESHRVLNHARRCRSIHGQAS